MSNRERVQQFALQEGSESASMQLRVLLLVDADVRHDPPYRPLLLVLSQPIFITI
jgi:hypothetical protein